MERFLVCSLLAVLFATAPAVAPAQEKKEPTIQNDRIPHGTAQARPGIHRLGDAENLQSEHMAT